MLLEQKVWVVLLHLKHTLSCHIICRFISTRIHDESLSCSELTQNKINVVIIFFKEPFDKTGTRRYILTINANICPQVETRRLKTLSDGAWVDEMKPQKARYILTKLPRLSRTSNYFRTQSYLLKSNANAGQSVNTTYHITGPRWCFVDDIFFSLSEVCV